MQIRSSRLIYAVIVLLALILTAGISSANYVTADLISHFGGSVRDVTVEGDHAYVSSDGLLIVDISDPTIYFIFIWK
ncbi:hypothetical protein [Methanomethylovorans sp.]|uniref:hypothetical protein n=1 Tax=Methanomethylovorans sp. TaxID=2758717 RepID=UPI00351C34D2